MTEMLESTRTPSDPELIAGVRSGNLDAYGELFARHTDAATRLARQLTRGSDAEDLVSEAFTKVMRILIDGGGPDVAFRAYLLTTVRRLYVDRVRRESRLTNSGDMTAFDSGVPFQDTVLTEFESSAAARAFAALPERWQLVLWHLEVENQKPADVAPLLGMSSNSVCALAHRAREGLRQAFLSAHLADTTDAQCQWTVEHLSAYVRRGLAKRDSTQVTAHLEVCRSCTAMHVELIEVNCDLRGIIGPLLLGTAATSYLAGAGSGTGVAGVLVLLGRARDALFGASGTSATTTGSATGATAGATTGTATVGAAGTAAGAAGGTAAAATAGSTAATMASAAGTAASAAAATTAATTTAAATTAAASTAAATTAAATAVAGVTTGGAVAGVAGGTSAAVMLGAGAATGVTTGVGAAGLAMIAVGTAAVTLGVGGVQQQVGSTVPMTPPSATASASPDPGPVPAPAPTPASVPEQVDLTRPVVAPASPGSPELPSTSGVSVDAEVVGGDAAEAGGSSVPSGTDDAPGAIPGDGSSDEAPVAAEPAPSPVPSDSPAPADPAASEAITTPPDAPSSSPVEPTPSTAPTAPTAPPPEPDTAPESDVPVDP